MHKLTLVLFAVALTAAPLCAQTPDAPMQPAAKAPTTKSASKPKLPVPPKNAPLTPLTPRERALLLLNCFTFAPRAEDVKSVLAQGPDNWFEQQLNPTSINDAALNRRLNDYPTLNMNP